MDRAGFFCIIIKPDVISKSQKVMNAQQDEKINEQLLTKTLGCWKIVFSPLHYHVVLPGSLYHFEIPHARRTVYFLRRLSNNGIICTYHRINHPHCKKPNSHEKEETQLTEIFSSL